MALIHRALLTWFLVVLFLVLIVIRLESKTSWSWFIVFIPMWIFNAIVLIYSTSFVINRCKSARNMARSNTGATVDYCSLIVRQRLCYIGIILLKALGEVLLCLKLDLPSWNLPLAFVLIPFWCILAVSIVSSGRRLVEMATSDPPPPPKDTTHLTHQSRSMTRRMNNPTTSALSGAGGHSHNYGIRGRRSTGEADGEGAAVPPRLNRATMAAMAIG